MKKTFISKEIEEAFDSEEINRFLPDLKALYAEAWVKGAASGRITFDKNINLARAEFEDRLTKMSNRYRELHLQTILEYTDKCVDRAKFEAFKAARELKSTIFNDGVEFKYKTLEDYLK